MRDGLKLSRLGEFQLRVGVEVRRLKMIQDGRRRWTKDASPIMDVQEEVIYQMTAEIAEDFEVAGRQMTTQDALAAMV